MKIRTVFVRTGNGVVEVGINRGYGNIRYYVKELEEGKTSQDLMKHLTRGNRMRRALKYKNKLE